MKIYSMSMKNLNISVSIVDLDFHFNYILFLPKIYEAHLKYSETLSEAAF